MAILHIVSKSMSYGDISRLLDRSSADDAYALVDDAVYAILDANKLVFNPHNLYVLGSHVVERGIDPDLFPDISFITMSQLVELTAEYASSMSWH